MEVLPVTRKASIFGFCALALVLLTVAPRPASATFHLMQIEQVIGGVDGDASKQAIQLRYRTSFQNLMSNARLYAWDANGENPIGVIAFPTNLATTAAGTRVLVTSAGFALSPAVTPDYVFTNNIPAAYLAAGSLTFEDDFGTVYWRLSWGGSNYLGDTTGDPTNDVDGQFGVFPAVLPSATSQALKFQGSSGAASNTNSADYAVTGGAATFTNSLGSSGTVQSQVGTPGLDLGGLALGPPAPNPMHASMTYSVNLPRAARATVGVFDLAGRRLFNLVDEELSAGPHSFSWAGASSGQGSLANGVYFLGLESEGSRVAKRFVVMR
jgi:hypothetical protein